jgi:hypothetical protein
MARRVTIDSQRITHVDGRPFFLIGARHMPDGATPGLLRDVGFNAYRRMLFGAEHAAAENLPTEAEGIDFWAYLFDRADLSKSPGYRDELTRRITELRDHPALLCYENYNEPTLLYKSTRFKTEPEALARGTALVRELDPHHPIWLCHACGNTVDALRRFNPCLDLVGCNPYPVYLPGMRTHVGMRPDGRVFDCIDQSVHAVGKYTDKMMAVAQGRPVWMLVQAMANENWYSPIHTPEHAEEGIDQGKIIYPTLEQLRFMAFDAIAAGATGLALSMYRTPVGTAAWASITRLVSELRALHDLLCAPPLPGTIEVTYADLGFTIWDGVRALARRRGNQVCLCAVNTAFDPAEATLRLPLDLEGVAVVNGEDREVPIRHSAIRDRFDPYGVHVYRMTATRSGPGHAVV